jgi:histidyl-tRNA synthetase
MARTRKQKQVDLPRGIREVLPDDLKYWRHILRKTESLLDYYGFEKIETPIVENADLYRRTFEDDENIDKKIVSIKNKDEVLALRYDYNAAIARAFVANGMNSWPHPIKLFFLGPVIRNSQSEDESERYANVLGAATMGDQSEIVDAELIFLGYKILEGLGFDNYNVHINSVGDGGSRTTYAKALKEYYKPKSKKLCAECRDLAKDDPVKVLRCLTDECVEINREAPQSVDFLDEDSRAHFKHIIEYLDEAKIPYILDHTLIKRRNYQMRTIFEYIPEGAARENEPIIWGGRFDRLVDQLGGAKTPAAGWIMNIDKMVQALRSSEANVPDHRPKPKIFFAQLGEMAKRKSLVLFESFRKAGIEAKSSLGRDNIKSQLRIAARYNVKYTLIFGQKEALDGTIILRDMETSVQETIPAEKIIDEIKKRLKNG